MAAPVRDAFDGSVRRTDARHVPFVRMAALEVPRTRLRPPRPGRAPAFAGMRRRRVLDTVTDARIPLSKGAAMEPLHLFTSLRTIRRHEHAHDIGIAATRDAIHRLAATPSPTGKDRRLTDDLERATKLKIGELAKVAERWLPR